MYIDNAYFRGELTVPNSQDYPNSHVDGNKFILSNFIAEYERELMVYGLGNELFTEFDNVFEPDGTLKAGTLQKWVDFIEGKEYAIDGRSFRWKGLRYTEGVIKKSLIAEYVYCKFLDFYSTSFNGVGMGIENPSNASRITSSPRIIEIWNDFIKNYQGCQNGSGAKMWISSHGLTTGVDYSSNVLDYFVSMDLYLTHFEIDFPNRNTFVFESKNTFGI